MTSFLMCVLCLPSQKAMGESLIHAQEITYKYTTIPYLLDNYMKLTIAVSHLRSGCVSSSGDDSILQWMVS